MFGIQGSRDMYIDVTPQYQLPLAVNHFLKNGDLAQWVGVLARCARRLVS